MNARSSGVIVVRHPAPRSMRAYAERDPLRSWSAFTVDVKAISLAIGAVFDMVMRCV
jgi:hypothetical protein